MCGRYKVSTKAPEILAAFGAEAGYDLSARYNVAPTDQVPVIRVVTDTRITETQERRVMVPMRWGLIPFWAKDESIGSRMLNARIETLFEKPAFRESLAERRCLVVADGFYEWRKTGPRVKDKQPYLFSFADSHVFAFAGLWARWKGPAGPVESCTVVTMEPNALLARFHDRMPLIFDPKTDAERIRAWLDPQLHDVDLAVLRVPRDLDGFRAFPVDTRVGNVRNDDPSLAEPLPQLFDETG
jgi:putative SOS response-associated peptidase YedK